MVPCQPYLARLQTAMTRVRRAETPRLYRPNRHETPHLNLMLKIYSVTEYEMRFVFCSIALLKYIVRALADTRLARLAFTWQLLFTRQTIVHKKKAHVLQYFTSPRKKSFLFPKRKAGLRHVVLPLAAIIGVYAFFSLLSSGPDDTTAAQASTSAAVVQTEGQKTTDGKNNMLAAFSATPVPPSYAYGANGKDTIPAEDRSRLSGIHASIQRFLQSSDSADQSVNPSRKVVKVSVDKGDTLMDLLIRNDVPRNDAYNAVEALRKVYNPRDLNPSHAITVFFHRDPSLDDLAFSGLQIQPDKINTVTVRRGSDGGFTADQQEKSVYRTLKGYQGTIDSSLYVSAKAAGVPDGVILDLIKMYSWNVDFQRDIQPGDKFQVMFEEYTTENGDVIPGQGNILFARLVLGSRDVPFYRFSDSAGETDYFDQAGHSAKKALMKTPIDGARISSGFGFRHHPVLGYSAMHKGIDFAAPRGTPVYAAGDGVIERIGPFSRYGNYVRIRHRTGLETAYAHLNGFRAGLSRGSRVKQGQVIAYVGTTGRSTGPHLHYEILISGKQVNPLGVKVPTGREVLKKDKAGFQAVVAERDSQFQRLLSGATIADSTPRKLQQQASR
jgi:murein DD-endopeptidase MepM/ murein hydrolase activator NlpD